MSYTYLQEQGEESSAECFSDIPAFVLLRLSLTAERYCSKGNVTESYQNSQSGTTCEHSTESLGEEKLMSSVEDSRAKTLAQPEEGLGLVGPEADCGRKWHEPFAKWNQDTFSWKIRQIWLFEGLEQSLEIWPKWGIMHDGECSEPVTSALHMSGPGFGFLELEKIPTPTATDHKRTPMKKQYANRPSTEGCPDDLAKWSVRQSGLEHARLVPDLWEWAMGWPLMWTGLKPLEMDKFQAWLHSHGKSCQET